MQKNNDTKQSYGKQFIKKYGLKNAQELCVKFEMNNMIVEEDGQRVLNADLIEFLVRNGHPGWDDCPEDIVLDFMDTILFESCVCENCKKNNVKVNIDLIAQTYGISANGPTVNAPNEASA